MLYSINSILYLGVRKGKHAHFAPRMRNPRIQSVEPATLAIWGTNVCNYPLIYSSTLQLTPNPRLASCSIPHRMPCCLARQLIFSLCPIPGSINLWNLQEGLVLNCTCSSLSTFVQFSLKRNSYCWCFARLVTVGVHFISYESWHNLRKVYWIWQVASQIDKP